MSAKKYNVALIGCGVMGAAHLDDICEKDNIILRCVCDVVLTVHAILRTSITHWLMKRIIKR